MPPVSPELGFQDHQFQLIPSCPSGISRFPLSVNGKAGGLYVDQKLIMTGNIDKLSEQEIEERMKQILKDHKDIIEGTSTVVTPTKPVKLKNIKKLN